MEPVDSRSDSVTGLPTISLYGDTESSLEPAREHFERLDVVVVDLQDVGSRYYTYVWTMLACMRVAVETSTQVVVCDRPNPIGGHRVEGGRIEEGYHSFVGGHDVAIRHGLTVGELAGLLVAELGLDVDLVVLPLDGWRREMLFADTGLPWVLPSPNMPTLETALVYPGGCLLEATELSEGRGTTKPFELVGADFVDGRLLVGKLAELELGGVGFRPTCFQPTFNKLAGKVCGGAQIHVLDETVFRPCLTGISVLWAIHELWPDRFEWRARPYEFVADRPAIDLLTGSPEVREKIEAGETPREITAGWSRDERRFLGRRRDFLLY
jgi:uncharacterized protein YbbC (DUF1343 family)